MSLLGAARLSFTPKPPASIEESRLPQGLLLDLMLRRLMIEGQATIHGLSGKLKLAVPIVDTLFRHMREQKLIEVKGMVGNDYVFTLSGAGRALASDRFQVSQYAGAAPVTLEEYHQATRSQAARVKVDRTLLRRAFGDLVLTDRLLDQLGPAIISQQSLFLYGPTGTGKTSLAERILRVYSDAVWIPYAFEVDGQIITVYDPVVHQALGTQPPEADARWVLCKRPCIIVGGELNREMLELRVDQATGIYSAPIQVKANNGVFVIDDFGRQLMEPKDLLNRWIVPLDRRVDYLTLRYGVKFKIPFEMMVVFSTNLDPYDLADEAFLRRIPNKIYVEPLEPAVFDEIFARLVASRQMEADPDSAQLLRRLCLSGGRKELRACYPGDILNILEAIGRYENRPVRLAREELERAVELYFARTADGPGESSGNGRGRAGMI